MAGRTHGTITETYEPMSTKALASHIRDAAVLLESNLDNTVRADVDLSRLVSRIGVAKAAGPALQATAPVPTLVNAKTGRFANAAAVAGPQGSLAALNGLLTATNPAEATAASAQWGRTAGLLGETVAALDAAKAALASSAATSWVQAALSQINRIQWAGGVYASRAGALAAHTANLASVAAANQVLTAAAHATWVALPSPEQKIAFEQAFLAQFPGSLTASLVPTNPVFNQLLPELSSMPGSDVTPATISAPVVAQFDAIALPGVVAEAFRQRGFGQLAEPLTPGDVVAQFGEVTPDTVQAISAGAAPTQVAALGTPSMPPTLAPGIGVAAHSADPPILPGALGQHAGPRHPASAGIPAAAFSSGGTPATGAGMMGGPHPGPLGGTRYSAPGPGAPSGGASRYPGAAPPGVTARAVSASAQQPPSHTAAGPVGAAPSRRSDASRKVARVKAVTSAVERDGNLRALLGRAPAVLPGVIGRNVTQPRQR